MSMSEPRPNDVQDCTEAPPAFWRVLLAPWVYVGSPSKAAACMAKARWPAAAVAYLLPVLAFGAAIIFLMVWNATVELAWRDSHYGMIERSFSEVWQDWHKHGVGWVELLFAFLVAFVPVLSGFVAWLLLPSVHRSGSVWRSYALAFRGAAAGAGLLTGLTFAIGAAAVALSNARDRNIGSGYYSPPSPVIILVGIGSLCSLIFWVSRAVRSLGEEAAAVELPPRCEGCGYDLTHQPASGLCPECGQSIAPSLTPGLRRPGCQWENEDRSPTTWLSTVRGVLFSPNRFYGALKLRSPMDAPQRFTGWNYVLIGAGTAAWMAVIAAEALNADFICFLPLLMMFLVLIVAWGLHRLTGALATSWWVMKGTLPDPSWARKVIAYESAYLWMFCLHNGAWVTTLTVNDRWLSQLFFSTTGSQLSLFGMWLEPLVLMGGNAALLLLWFWRYHLAARAIRWSNF